MEHNRVQWKKELENLVASARNPEEKAAIESFAKALGPHLENPAMLRTLLGKIQAPLLSQPDQVLVTHGKFKDVNELKSALPKDINVVQL